MRCSEQTQEEYVNLRLELNKHLNKIPTYRKKGFTSYLAAERLAEALERVKKIEQRLARLEFMFFQSQENIDNIISLSEQLLKNGILTYDVCSTYNISKATSIINAFELALYHRKTTVAEIFNTWGNDNDAVSVK